MHARTRACLMSAFALWLAATHDEPPRAAQQDTAAAQRSVPSFPFRYSGRLERQGLPPLAALTRGADTLLRSVGETIDANYRLEEVGARHIVVMYVPLKQKQTIELSSGPTSKRVETPSAEPAAAPKTPLGTRGPACC
jgi:hypothetical protein